MPQLDATPAPAGRRAGAGQVVVWSRAEPLLLTAGAAPDRLGLVVVPVRREHLPTALAAVTRHLRPRWRSP